VTGWRRSCFVAHDEYLNRTYTIDNPEPLSLERRFNEKMAKRQRKVEQLKCVWLEAADALEAEKLRRAVSEGAQARVQYRLLQHEYTVAVLEKQLAEAQRNIAEAERAEAAAALQRRPVPELAA